MPWSENRLQLYKEPELIFLFHTGLTSMIKSCKVDMLLIVYQKKYKKQLRRLKILKKSEKIH